MLSPFLPTTLSYPSHQDIWALIQTQASLCFSMEIKVMKKWGKVVWGKVTSNLGLEIENKV